MFNRNSACFNNSKTFWVVEQQTQNVRLLLRLYSTDPARVSSAVHVCVRFVLCSVCLHAAVQQEKQHLNLIEGVEQFDKSTMKHTETQEKNPLPGTQGTDTFHPSLPTASWESQMWRIGRNYHGKGF